MWHALVCWCCSDDPNHLEVCTQLVYVYDSTVLAVQYGAQVDSSHCNLSGVSRMLLKCRVSRANHKVSNHTNLINNWHMLHIVQRWPWSWEYYHVYPVPLCLTGRTCICVALLPSTSRNPHPQVHLHGHVLLLCQYRQQLCTQLQCTSPSAHDFQIGKF